MANYSMSQIWTALSEWFDTAEEVIESSVVVPNRYSAFGPSIVIIACVVMLTILFHWVFGAFTEIGSTTNNLILLAEVPVTCLCIYFGRDSFFLDNPENTNQLLVSSIGNYQWLMVTGGYQPIYPWMKPGSTSENSFSRENQVYETKSSVPCADELRIEGQARFRWAVTDTIIFNLNGKSEDSVTEIGKQLSKYLKNFLSEVTEGSGVRLDSKQLRSKEAFLVKEFPKYVAKKSKELSSLYGVKISLASLDDLDYDKSSKDLLDTRAKASLTIQADIELPEKLMALIEEKYPTATDDFKHSALELLLVQSQSAGDISKNITEFQFGGISPELAELATVIIKTPGLLASITPMLGGKEKKGK